MHESPVKLVKNINLSTYNAFLFILKYKFAYEYCMYLDKALPNFFFLKPCCTQISHY